MESEGHKEASHEPLTPTKSHHLDVPPPASGSIHVFGIELASAFNLLQKQSYFPCQMAPCLLEMSLCPWAQCFISIFLEGPSSTVLSPTGHLYKAYSISDHK